VNIISAQCLFNILTGKFSKRQNSGFRWHKQPSEFSKRFLLHSLQPQLNHARGSAVQETKQTCICAGGTVINVSATQREKEMTHRNLGFHANQRFRFGCHEQRRTANCFELTAAESVAH